MAKKMIIKGVGTLMAKKYNAEGTGAEVITLGTLQDLKIDFNVEIDDIFGGDGLFAIDTLVKSKSIEISATDTKLDLAAMTLMLGSKITEVTTGSDAYVWTLGAMGTAVAGTNGKTGEVGEEVDVNVAVVTVDINATIFAADPSFQVKLKEANTLLEEVSFATATSPAEGKFMYDAVGGKLILPAANVGADIVFNYKRASASSMAAVLSDEIPFPVHIVHHGSFLQKDNTYAGVETELYSCIANGTWSIGAERVTASASSVALKVIDPERADKRLGTVKRYDSATRI